MSHVGRRVFIVSASMGAGHDGAARELARRVVAAGDEARVVDFLDAGPLGTGHLMRLGYELQLKLAPWLYEATLIFTRATRSNNPEFPRASRSRARRGAQLSST